MSEIGRHYFLIKRRTIPRRCYWCNNNQDDPRHITEE